MSYRTLLFSYSDTTFMLSAGLCREVFSAKAVLPLPAAHTALLGLTEVRGRAVPLLNLAALYVPHGGQGQIIPSGSVAHPTLALLVDIQGELLALPVEQMLGISAVDALPDAPGMVFESAYARNRDVQYIHPSALLGTVHSLFLHV